MFLSQPEDQCNFFPVCGFGVHFQKVEDLLDLHRTWLSYIVRHGVGYPHLDTAVSILFLIEPPEEFIVPVGGHAGAVYQQIEMIVVNGMKDLTHIREVGLDPKYLKTMLFIKPVGRKLCITQLFSKMDINTLTD